MQTLTIDYQIPPAAGYRGLSYLVYTIFTPHSLVIFSCLVAPTLGNVGKFAEFTDVSTYPTNDPICPTNECW